MHGLGLRHPHFRSSDVCPAYRVNLKSISQAAFLSSYHSLNIALRSIASQMDIVNSLLLICALLVWNWYRSRPQQQSPLCKNCQTFFSSPVKFSTPQGRIFNPHSETISEVIQNGESGCAFCAWMSRKLEGTRVDRNETMRFTVMKENPDKYTQFRASSWNIHAEFASIDGVLDFRLVHSDRK
jgi:hypothetical protein